MARYKVVIGHHVDVAGKIHPKGSIIDSDKPLDKLFHGKFKRIGADGEEYEEPKPKSAAPVPTVLRKAAPSEDAAETEDENEEDDEEPTESKFSSPKPHSAKSTVVTPAPKPSAPSHTTSSHTTPTHIAGTSSKFGSKHK